MNLAKFKHNIVSSGSGLCGGLLGIGGAFLYIPMVIKYIGTENKRAHAQALAMGLASALVGSVVYVMTLQWESILYALLLAVLGIFGSVVGSRILDFINTSWLQLLFGFILLFMMTIVILRPILPTLDLPLWILPVFGFFIGMLGGLLGIGGGSIIVPLLLLGYGLPQSTVQGIALLTIIPTTASGLLSHFYHKRIKFSDISVPAIFSACAGAVGAFIAINLPEFLLQILFISFMGYSALYSIIKGSSKLATTEKYMVKKKSV